MVQEVKAGDAALRAGRPGARGAPSLALGSGAAQAITVLVAPIITRLYTPADIGAAGVLSGVMLLVAPAACLRFDLAISLAREKREAARLCALSLIAGASVAALLGVAALLFGGALCRAANVPQMSAYTWLVPLQAAIAAPGLVGVGLLTRRRRYGSPATAR